MGGIIKCCGIWLARDCWLKYARETCIEERIADINKLPFRLLPKLDQWCNIYHDQSFVCLLPHYLPFIFMFIAIIVTVVLVLAFMWKLKKKKKARARKNNVNTQSSTNNETSVKENLLDQNQNIRQNR